ncbi:heterokaryon incompatibility 6 OR allele [Fusarium coicis]|nr:heterokaryon incompatibility 6 OR allele [Fusarium coicis]
MGIIYSSAIKVLCHIGEETENFTIILDAMERYWKRNIRRRLLLGQGDSLMLPGESAAKLLDLPYPADEEADAIEDVKGGEWPARYLEFISAPWFHRLWVVQEFVLRRHVLMIVGRRHIPWGLLWVGILWFKGVKWPWDPVKFTNEDLVSLFTSYNSMCLVRSCRLIDLNILHGREFNDIAQVLLNGLEMNQVSFSLDSRAFNFFTGPESSVGYLDTLYPLTSDPVREAALRVMLDYNEQDTMSPDDEEFKALLRMGLSLPSVVFSKDAEKKDDGRRFGGNKGH